jgi:hypothetical protein
MARPARSWEPAGRDQQEWGCIVTVQNAEGKTLSLHRKGPCALDEALDDAISLDPTFLVVSISTPLTIYHDLDGREPHPHTDDIQIPERQKLGRVRRLELLHPRLRPRSAFSYRRAQARGETWR